jgi:stringent starvation protein B
MAMAGDLISTRPYLLRAMHEWMSDNDETPLVVVDATAADANVPVGHVKDGRIVLNMGWSATRNLQMTNELVSFEARFGGVSHAVSFPLAAVQGIYARESGQGMLFQDEAIATALGPTAVAENPPSGSSPDGGSDDDSPPPKGPGLRLVK